MIFRLLIKKKDRLAARSEPKCKSSKSKGKNDKSRQSRSKSRLVKNEEFFSYAKDVE
jgi:hypothetical protein